MFCGIILQHIQFGRDVYFRHYSTLCIPAHVNSLVTCLKPYLIANVMYVAEGVRNVVWLCAQRHSLRPDCFVWYLKFKSRLNTKMYSFPNTELLHLFMTLKLLLHLFQPEFHCIIYDFNRAALYDSCADRG